jgi:hypothetical protein
MKEIFVIYNKNTGFIVGGTGRVDKEWDDMHKDGSTISERITQILAENSNNEVIYLPNQSLPDPERHKIEDNKIVELTPQEKIDLQANKPKSELELLKERVSAIEKQLGI